MKNADKVKYFTLIVFNAHYIYYAYILSCCYNHYMPCNQYTYLHYHIYDIHMNYYTVYILDNQYNYYNDNILYNHHNTNNLYN